MGGLEVLPLRGLDVVRDLGVRFSIVLNLVLENALQIPSKETRWIERIPRLNRDSCGACQGRHRALVIEPLIDGLPDGARLSVTIDLRWKLEAECVLPAGTLSFKTRLQAEVVDRKYHEG